MISAGKPLNTKGSTMTNKDSALKGKGGKEKENKEDKKLAEAMNDAHIVS